MKGYWRERAAPIIAEVLARTKGEPESVIRKALTAAYPFGERRMYPYKAWLKEVKHQRGRGSAAKPQPAPTGQLTMLEE